jgi:Spy/CpxP family protein refolding chaperone
MIVACMTGVTLHGINAMADEGGDKKAGEGYHCNWKHMNVAEVRAADMKALHDKLKLTDTQEVAWAKFAAATEPKPGVPSNMVEEKSLTVPQRMERMLDRIHQHEQLMSVHLVALKEFYAVLTPEQQKVFDTASSHHHHHWMHEHEMHEHQNW